MKKPISFFFYSLICAYPIALLVSCNNAPETEKKKELIIDTVAPTSLPNSFAAPDQSPMDMSYFPPAYPLQKMKGKDSGPPVARVIYSRPHKKGRVIFGDSPQSLCQYGKPWRLGANEASEIEFFRNVSIHGNKISKGRYIIYCVPHADRWTIKLNANLYSWGLEIDSTQDVFKTDIPTLNLNPSLEDFTMVFVPADHGTDLLMAWDDKKVLLPINW